MSAGLQERAETLIAAVGYSSDSEYHCLHKAHAQGQHWPRETVLHTGSAQLSFRKSCSATCAMMRAVQMISDLTDEPSVALCPALQHCGRSWKLRYHQTAAVHTQKSEQMGFGMRSVAPEETNEPTGFVLCRATRQTEP
jgi:hypothetical protein